MLDTAKSKLRTGRQEAISLDVLSRSSDAAQVLFAVNRVASRDQVFAGVKDEHVEVRRNLRHPSPVGGVVKGSRVVSSAGALEGRVEDDDDLIATEAADVFVGDIGITSVADLGLQLGPPLQSQLVL